MVPNPDKNGEFFEAHLGGFSRLLAAAHLRKTKDFESTPAEAKSGKTGMLASVMVGLTDLGPVLAFNGPNGGLYGCMT